jgi:hypothetical protein
MRIWIQPAEGADPYEVREVKSVVQEGHTVRVTLYENPVQNGEKTYDGELVKVKE